VSHTLEGKVKRLATAICISGLPWLMRATSSASALDAADPSGSVISGAKVTWLRTETGIKRTDLTTGTGDYNFSLVNPGLYPVAVPGFWGRTQQIASSPHRGRMV